MNSEIVKKPKRSLLLGGGVAIVLLLGGAAAAWFMLDPGLRDEPQVPALTADMPQDEFERRIRDYLLANPEIILAAVQGLEARQREAAEGEAQTVLRARADEIFRDATSPVGGNPEGDVTLVEFFDYNCPYCRKAVPMLDTALQADQGLRLVFKEFPILGPGSTFAARAALAAQKQGKYLIFHKAMMAYSGAITESSSLQVAADVGLDVEQMKRDMQDPAIDQAIQRNQALAQALRLSGTPSFIIGKEIVRGLVDLDTIKQLIAATRQD